MSQCTHSKIGRSTYCGSSIFRLGGGALGAWVLLLSAFACSAEDAPSTDTPPQNLSTGGNGGASSFTGDCDFGDDAEKCGGLDNSLCLPELNETGTSCETDAECEPGSLCFAVGDSENGPGECLAIVGVCEERCAGDFECREGEVCNPASGKCAPDYERGDRFGASCSPDSENCAGECVEVRENEWECEELCRVGATSGCGHESLSESGVACAYFAYDLSDLEVSQGQGDAGVCAELCDCNDDCPGSQRCLFNPQEGFEGVCTGGVEEDESLSECPPRSNQGGAGGAPNE